MEGNTFMLNMMPVVGSVEIGMAFIHFLFEQKEGLLFTCLVIPLVAVIIQPSNNIVKFVENIVSVKTKYATLIFRRENRIVSNKIMF